MKDDVIKRTIGFIYQKLVDVKKTIDEIILQKIETGDYIDVNETRLEAIIDMLKDQVLMANLKKRLYIK